jgi:hypothetical protein
MSRNMNIDRGRLDIGLPSELKKRIKRVIESHPLRPSAGQWIRSEIERALEAAELTRKDERNAKR